MYRQSAPQQVHQHRKEFGGTLGATFMIFGLPLVIYAINIACNEDSCTILSFPNIPALTEVFSIEACGLFIGWFFFQVLLSVLPFGTVATGLPIKSTGKSLQYRCNGFISLLISLLLFLILYLSGVRLTYVYDNYLHLVTAAILFSLTLAVYLYARSLSQPLHDLAPGGHTGSIIYDFFIGRELNPRVGPVDLKFFCELRPGLIGWVMLDLCFVLKGVEQGRNLDELRGLILVTMFHTLYVADALYHEEAILTTMDIVHDGFGLMLALGDLAWVPCLYSLQARFVLEHPRNCGSLELAGIFILNIVGFFIFRKSNSEKNDFRQNPNSPALKHLRTLKTESGRELIISGLWGLSRHPNYLGDLIMALSWSLVTGYQNILPYFYPIYFLGLLVHRSLRDEFQCKQKYGRDWVRYCQLVPYRIFPYIY